MTPTRLWAQIHDNGWETWIADREDDTYGMWVCRPGEDGSSWRVEDTFGHAVDAVLIHLKALTGHVCATDCGVWTEREPPPRRSRRAGILR